MREYVVCLCSTTQKTYDVSELSWSQLIAQILADFAPRLKLVGGSSFD